MKDSTTSNPTIEYRLDSYGDDLNDCLEGFDIPEFHDHIKNAVRSGYDLGLLEHITTTLSDMNKNEPTVFPTYFKEYRARLMFMDSVDEDCHSCQNYLVRTARLAEELLRFPHNPNLLAALRASDDVVTIKARIWSTQPFDEWTRDLGLLLGMSGDEFNEKMVEATERYQQMRMN